MSQDPKLSAEPDSLERPEHGGRLLARLLEAGTDEAVYAVAIANSAATWTGRARVTHADGRVDAFEWQPSDTPPSWLTQATHALLRSAWQRCRAGHPWPRRLARWRPSPEEADA
jgi:hypothetical protein